MTHRVAKVVREGESSDDTQGGEQKVVRERESSDDTQGGKSSEGKRVQ